MPYPLETPLSKHDLYIPRSIQGVSPDTNLMDRIGLRSTSEVFQQLASDHIIPKEDYHLITSIYTYPSDTPKPPLARELFVLGVSDSTVSMIRKLGLDDDPDDNSTTVDCLQKSTIACKRADGKYRSQLPPDVVTKCHNFSTLIQQLYEQQLFAIIGPPDKYGRFVIVKAMPDYIVGSVDAQNFAAFAYVGIVSKVKDYLTGGGGGAVQQKSKRPISTDTNGSYTNKKQKTSDDSYNPSDGLWKPPGGDDGGYAHNFGTSNNNDGDDDGGLWKPPGAEDNNDTGDSGGLWKPPGSDENDTSDFSNPFGTNTTSYDFNSNNTKNEDKYDQDENDEPENDANKFHADSGAAAADRFYSSLTRTLDTRADSRLYHMRAFNGWVKGTQIQELDPKTTSRKLRVLDLACGKGGDLGKWTLHPRGLSNYVGIDVARGSLLDAAIRARKMKNKFHKNQCTFTCADLGSDVPGRYKNATSKTLQKLLSWSLANEKNEHKDPDFNYVRGGGISLNDKFDVVSVQFAIHYMMQTRKRARRFFQTVAQLLEVGGNLIATTIDARIVIEHLLNLGYDLHMDDPDTKVQQYEDAVIKVGDGACRIRFEPAIVQKIFHTISAVNSTELGPGNINENLFGLEYTFTLVEGSDHASGVGDAVNLPEWLIPIPVLQALAAEVGLELVYAQNFHEFYTNRSDPKEFSSLHNTMYNMKVLNMNGSISQPEWDISRLYVAVKFKKVKDVTTFYTDDDDDDANGDDDENNDDDDDDDDADNDNEEEEDVPEIDPTVKAKLFPMALMKAKKTVRNDVWATLSSDEKNHYTDIELRKLIK